MTGRGRCWVGTSGFSYAHWRHTLYPQGLPQSRWLEHYAQQFPTVELNSTFYRLPSEKSVRAWRERTPREFTFAVKASRVITHYQRLKEVEKNLDTFLGRAVLLKEKLGPLLYQLPPDMERDEARLEYFLALLPRSLRHVLEFRSQDWHRDSVYDLMGHYDVALCVHDMARSESPVAATASFAYFRFHGPSSRYQGRYSDQQLAEWADRILGLAGGRDAVYAYFNNDIGGHAVGNAKTLAGLLSERG